MAPSMALAVVCSSMLLLLASSGPVPEFKGRESVFNYVVTVGRQSSSGSYQQGFQVSSKVIARQRADGAYNIRMSDIEVRCQKNQAINKEKYKDLEAALARPFDFDMANQQLRVYSPETVTCESVNIKRGLVNVLEVYDDESKQLVKLSSSGSSGRCLEVEKKVPGSPERLDSDSSRYSNLETNCSATLPHQLVKSTGLAKFGTFCNSQPKVRRSVNYKIKRSLVGAALPKLSISSNERVALESSFPNGLFDNMLAKSQLDLVEVRDASAFEWVPADVSATTTTEVDITQDVSKSNQEEGLKRAVESFKMVGHCLDKFEAGDHLEDQDLPDVIVGLTMSLGKLNKASLETLYKSITGTHRNAAFLQILGVVGGLESFQAVRDLFVKASADGTTNTFKLGEDMAGYFERLDPKTGGVVTVNEMLAFATKLVANDKAHPKLRTSVLLAASAMYSEVCNNRKVPADAACPSGDALVAMMTANFPDNTDEQTIAKIKIAATTAVREFIPVLKAIISDKARSITQRSSATWALVRLAPRFPADLKQFLMELFFDATEDHEVRIAAYVSIAKSGSINELTSAVTYIVDNAETEDCQVVHYVVSSVKNLRNFRQPDGSLCPSHTTFNTLWESTVEKVSEKYGPKSAFDSSVYVIQSESKREMVLISIVSSKTDLLPRSIYLSARDQLQARSLTINTVSDGVVYGNLAKLKAAQDQMRAVVKTVDGDVKAKLAAILDAAEAVRPSGNFTLLLATQNDGYQTGYDFFTRPEQILHRLLAKTVSADRYLRSFNKFNDVRIRTHTESGVRISFATAQGAVTSIEVPAFTLGQMGRTGLPIAFRYGYKFVSRTFFATVASLPASKFKYVSGRVTDKALSIPRNVTLNVMRRQVDNLVVVTIKGKSDPLRGSQGKDLFYRALTPFSGNLMGMHETKKLLSKESQSPTEVIQLGHDYVGFGWTTEKSVAYTRPCSWKSALTRWCHRYQEIDDQITPYTFKVSATPNPAAPAGTISQLSWQINVATGVKSGQYVRMAAITLDSPLDATKKAIRIVVGKSIDVNDPNKRLISVAYENSVKNLYVRNNYVILMPDNGAGGPAVAGVSRKAADWADVYATQQITVKGTGKFTPSGRSDFDLEADLADLLTPLADPDATASGFFYRTAEQAALYSREENKVDVSDESNDDTYSRLLAASAKHAKSNFRTWDALLKFHGAELELTATRPTPAIVQLLWRRLTNVMIKRHYAHLSYDVESKAAVGQIKLRVNSTVDSRRTDLSIQDKNGLLQFSGFKSKMLIPLLRPSSAPVKVYHNSILNLPVCTLSASAERSEIETFDGEDISADELRDGCSYLLAGNCRGRRTFSISYTRSDNSYTILYDDSQKIVITEKGFVVNGTAKADKEGLVGKVGDTIMLSYKGLLKVVLPNRVEVTREKNSSVGYIKVSNLFRGRLCGLCGDLNGDQLNDKSIQVASMATGTCAAAR